eukprot:8808650-Pyramimonas_sp.AAC.2
MTSTPAVPASSRSRCVWSLAKLQRDVAVLHARRSMKNGTGTSRGTSCYALPCSDTYRHSRVARTVGRETSNIPGGTDAPQQNWHVL